MNKIQQNITFIQYVLENLPIINIRKNNWISKMKLSENKNAITHVLFKYDCVNDKNIEIIESIIDSHFNSRDRLCIFFVTIDKIIMLNLQDTNEQFIGESINHNF